MSELKIVISLEKDLLERFVNNDGNDDEAHDYVVTTVKDAASRQLCVESRENLPA